jgi:hypothetical protein
MRKLVAVLIAVVCFPAFAQRERAPIVAKDVERAADRIRFQKAGEERHREHPLRSDKLKDAVRDFLLGDYNVPKLHATFAEFTTASGEYFVALHLALPPSINVPDDVKLTFFGVVEDAARRARWSVEEPAAVKRSKTNQYVERSIVVPAQIFTGIFGLARDGQPIGMVSMPMDLLDVSKGTRRISRMLLANEVFALDKPQQPLDPFVFGGIKVIPQADRTFHRKEEMWVFFESQNPALANDGAPRFTARVEAVSLTPGTERLLRSNALTTALPLKGVPGHFGVGTTLDISRLTPGDWKLRVSVADTLASENYELLETIHVVD